MTWRLRAVFLPPIFALASLLAAVVLLAGCEGSAPYRIGVVLDADGLRAATLATEQINANGGINGHPLELRYVGGAGSTKAKLALETAEHLAADPSILAVVGHTNSGASIAASQVYNARRIAQIAPTSTTPLYGVGSPYSFRLVASDVHQGAFLAEQAIKRTTHPRVAIIFTNDDYGRPLGKVVAQRLRGAGVQPVYETPYAEDDTVTDYHELVESMTLARPDLLIWIGRAYDFVDIQPLIKVALPNLEVIASDGFDGPLLLHDSLHRFDGVQYVRLVDLERPNPSLRLLRTRYLRDGFGEPSDQAVLSHDAVSLLAEAIRQAGPNREAIRDWLAQVGRGKPGFPGLSGPVVFVSGGDRAPQYFLRRLGAFAPTP